MVCLWMEWREGRGDALAGRVGRALATGSLALFVLGMLLGLVLGWLHWSEQYAETLSMLRSKIYFGVWELIFSAVLMLLHVVWWNWQPLPGSLLRGVRMLLPLLAGTNLLYHFMFLFAVIAEFDSEGRVPSEVIDAAAFRALMMDPVIYTRVVHFLVAAFAVTGTAIMAWSVRRVSAGDESLRRAAVWGARLALVPTLIQIPVGVWFMSQLPPATLQRVMGGDFLATTFFVVSLLCAFGMMHKLADVSLGETNPRTIRWCVLLMVVIVTLMTGTLERAMPSSSHQSALTSGE
jgi:hypothetical protein